jgi:hypothetical protein
MYIKRDEQRGIIAVSRVATDECVEAIDSNAEELQDFLREIQPQHKKDLANSDLEMVRVLEDLVGLLIERSVIRFTDLPSAAQTKLLSRHELRSQHQGMNLLDDDDDLTL